MASYDYYKNNLLDYYAAQGPAPVQPYFDPQAEVSGYSQPAGYADELKAYQDYTTKTGQGWLDTLTPQQRAEYDQYHQQAVAANAKKARIGAIIAFGAPLLAAGAGALGAFGAAGSAGEGAAAAGAAAGGGEAAGAGGLGSFVFNPAVDSQLASAAAGITGADAAAAATVPSWAQGAAGAAWTGGVPAAGGGLSQVGDALTKYGGKATDWALKNPAEVAALVGGVGSLVGAGGGGGGGSTANATPGMTPVAARDMGRASVYSDPGYTANTTPASRPGHTMGPSSAVNLQDPSSALFGYGQLPTYYKPPGMAEGGEVEAPSWIEPPQTDLHRPPFDDGRRDTVPTPTKGWIQRLLDGDKSAVNQALIGGGALGFIASLLSKRQKNPGFRSIAEMQSGMSPSSASGIPPGYLANMSSYFNSPASHYVAPPPMLGSVSTGGRPLGLAHGGRPFDSREVSHVNFGEGGGQDDMVPANLSPGEYVWDADVVSALGDGSNEAGAAALDRAREEIRRHKRSAPADSIPPRAKSPLEYLRGSK